MEYDLSFLDKSNLTWLKSNTIFLTVHGSNAYGLNTPTSDIDYKGIAIPPKEYFTSFMNNFEQAEFRNPNPDCCIFNILKWLGLACDNNPSVIEILWTNPKHWVITSEYWEEIIQHRDKFLSKNIKHRFSGYAIQQLKKMKRHFRYLNFPVKEPPQRSDFGLPNHFVLPKEQLDAALSIIQKKIDCWNPDLSMMNNSERIAFTNGINDILGEIVGASLYLEKDNLWKSAALSIGMDSNFIELIQKEKEYKGKKEDWKHYCKWKKNRNTKRADIEAKIGYDAKDAAALVRIMRMAKEILSTGKVIVERIDDREELLAIKNGAWEYDKIIEYAENMEKELDELYKTSSLPKEPDRKFIDKLCQRIVESYLLKEK